ncbi:G-type lectin S-receptor-like serine/threonine-protein kinase At1g61360 [Cryptomeria japonica]|uniref:G-type lectin S-receptor-like serine/threonine-protein kinase At1g61360 n=1 Tax=Cryptomeria japonica TaxID=3369 RepID=UPI0027DAABAF|nr:G-type lectin S-receptor-like serine/threonine-protein kinase At1g61360 [Cryptomeria japonica]
MGFATGSANYSASGMLYGLVQCWRDISIQDCTSCLDTARAKINNSSNQGAQVQLGSCKDVEEDTLTKLNQVPKPVEIEKKNEICSSSSDEENIESSNIETGTLDYGLWYPRNNDFTLVGFTDSDWAGCLDDRKSTSGPAFFLGDCLVAWHSKKQGCVTLSTANGHLAPEYAMLGQLSIKVDVYSFGMLLLEIITGRKNFDIHLSYEMQNLIQWAWKLFKRGDALNMVDSRASEADATLRPVMSNVIMMLSSTLVALPNPSTPAFISNSENHPSTSKSKSMSRSGAEEYEKGTTSETTKSSVSGIPSINESSITQMDASLSVVQYSLFPENLRKNTVPREGRLLTSRAELTEVTSIASLYQQLALV